MYIITLRPQATGDEAVRKAFPGATVLKPAVMIGTEDRIFNSYVSMAKNMPFVPVVRLVPSCMRLIFYSVHADQTRTSRREAAFATAKIMVTALPQRCTFTTPGRWRGCARAASVRARCHRGSRRCSEVWGHRRQDIQPGRPSHFHVSALHSSSADV